MSAKFSKAQKTVGIVTFLMLILGGCSFSGWKWLTRAELGEANLRALVLSQHDVEIQYPGVFRGADQESRALKYKTYLGEESLQAMFVFSKTSTANDALTSQWVAHELLYLKTTTRASQYLAYLQSRTMPNRQISRVNLAETPFADESKFGCLYSKFIQVCDVFLRHGAFISVISVQMQVTSTIPATYSLELANLIDLRFKDLK
jgi:hypothetical protein